jgi:hypothetical protein
MCRISTALFPLSSPSMAVCVCLAGHQQEAWM